MKIDTDALVTGLDGKPVVLADAELTLGRVCIEALLGTYPKEDADGLEKLRRFELAQRMHGGGIIETNPEELVLIRRLVGIYFVALVAGRVWQMLDSEAG